MGYKTKSQRFVDALSKGLLAAGATKLKNDITDREKFILNTVVGLLAISIDKEVQHCYTMFSRFENVQEAKQKFDCNPHSGKYNCHIGNNKDMTPEKAAEICMIAIERTLPKETV